MKIVCVLTTKDRPGLFSRALSTVEKQNRRPDRVIVVSDSASENHAAEEGALKGLSVPCEYLSDGYTHNYAGSLNTAVYAYVSRNLSDIAGFENTYVAILDDDDAWDESYLGKCERAAAGGADFVVSGLIYCNEDGERRLSIPQELSLDDFLKGNPHIQGSNTFIKLSVLLRAGLFDENMSSTTDRDIFTRVMMLSPAPSYAAVREHLVRVNAFNDRERITNGQAKKRDGLRKFYYKYHGFMSDGTEEAFFARARDLFGIEREDITAAGKRDNVPPEKEVRAHRHGGRLAVGFIVTDYGLGLRLLRQLAAMRRPDTKIVILFNCKESQDTFREVLEKSGYDYRIFAVEDARRLFARSADLFVRPQDLGGETIKDIAVARSALQGFLYGETEDGDAVWVLDEDMELEWLCRGEDGFETRETDIDGAIAEYRGKYDAVIGRYTLDAPLPALSTIRTGLLDYFYNSRETLADDAPVGDLTDYYYDLSEENTAYTETPFRASCGGDLADIFSGKAYARKLFVQGAEVRPVRSRGGNTLIFRREMLLIPNWSLRVGDRVGRRGDHFWALLARREGYRIADVPFATLHNRRRTEFDYAKESDKLLSDLIGASFVRAFGETGPDSPEAFCEAYRRFFSKRLARYVCSHFRVQGLLGMLGDEGHARVFTPEALQTFADTAQGYMRGEEVRTAYAGLCASLREREEADRLRRTAETHLGARGLRMLGSGGEAVVFTDGATVFKCFRRPLRNKGFLRSLAGCFPGCAALHGIRFLTAGETDVICYPYEEYVPYGGGHAREVAELLRFGKENGVVFDNIKKENFVVCGGTLKYIDYGVSLLPCSEGLFLKTVKRAYEMLRYPFLDAPGFRELIARSYRGETEFLDDGWENLFRLTLRRQKEDLHDGTALRLIRRHAPASLLDYGAGKCKIVNALSGQGGIPVLAAYDIDTVTLCRRAAPGVRVITDISSVPDASFDAVTCNQVLCCVGDDAAEAIAGDISRVLKPGGCAVISICDPFFNGVQHTELRLSGLPGGYGRARRYEKRMAYGGTCRTEFHRPAEYYRNLFLRWGLRILSTCEGEGIDTDSLLPAAEHLFFECEKFADGERLDDCTLMIKTNPMEHACIYGNIAHITGALERGIRFAERVAVADLTECADRARRYCGDDAAHLLSELGRAKENGLIDRIVCAEDGEGMARCYRKYFDCVAPSGHSRDGQGIYASLCGFESVKTPYVLQTDSDILYHVSADAMRENLDALRGGALTSCLGIFPGTGGKPTEGHRTEVRTCFLSLRALQALLPLHNELDGDAYALSWHRALDRRIGGRSSVRFCRAGSYFIHPENGKKNVNGFMGCCARAAEQGSVPALQRENVNLQGGMKDWVRKTKAGMAVFICGRDTPCGRLKRMFDSLRAQTYTDFEVVFVDDASGACSRDYIRLTLETDEFFRGRSVAVFNDTSVGSLANLVFAMENIVLDPETVVVNLDSDDCLVSRDALQKIADAFAAGAELTCGNCVRHDKPLKRYRVVSFDRPWEREGDNLWLHPKCFRRRLFGCIDTEKDLKLDGEFVDVNCDFAIMLPMAQNSKKNVFIEDVLYYFEPSVENVRREGKYDDARKKRIRDILLKRAEERAKATDAPGENTQEAENEG